MDFMTKKIFFLLLVCWISFEGDADTFVPEVQTLPSVFLEEGVEGKLTCGYDRNVYAVYWRYKSTTSPMKLLIVMDRYYQVGEKSGPGYEEGRFDMTDEYSLIIHNVSAKDEGRYMCEVSDLASGDAFRNYTDVTTIVKAERPFPRIGQCEDEVSADEVNAPCVLHATSDDSRIELTCTILGAKPMAILSWTSSLSSEHWKRAVNESTLTKKERGDGIFDQTLGVNVDASFFTSHVENFTCVAEGLAVDGIANQTIEISFTLDHVVDEGVNVTMVAVTSTVCILLLLIVLISILWKANNRHPNNWCGGNGHSKKANYALVEKNLNESALPDSGENSQLTEADCEPIGDNSQPIEADVEPVERKRLEVGAEITRGNHKPIYFGIFGSTEAGRSAFIDSLIFALTEKNHTEIPDAIPAYRDTAWRISIKRPSDFIALCEMKDMDFKRLEQCLKPISEDEGCMSKGDAIHYPVIVSDIGKHMKDSSYEESLARFSEAVMTSISKYPILVLTHKNTSEIPDRERIISRLSLKTDIPVDNIFVTGSKRVDDTAKEDEIIQLLELLLKCVKNFTGNISLTESKRLGIREEIIGRKPKPLYFGIFGSDAEKSSLIHSLIFAFAGGNHKEIPDAIPAYRDTIQRMSIKRPSKFIALCDMRYMYTSPKEVGQLLKPLCTDEGSMIKDDVIHYPIVVYKIGKHKIHEKSLELFSKAVMASISKYPVLVLTHKNPSEIPDREGVISRLSSKTTIPADNIFFTGNSMFDETTEEDDILQLLEILLSCVKNVID